MATTGLLALLDDITTLLDDVATMSKVAVKKTAGIVGDDLAVGANSVTEGGIDPKRELPIVGKIFLGSLANKAVLIPIALAIPSAAIVPMLMCGGAYLCYEAFHKITHKKDAKDEEHHQKMLEAIKSSPGGLAKLENKRVWQAIVTDTVLSAEIVAVSIGTMAVGATLAAKAATLAAIGLGMTLGVYGLVGLIVKLDDIGLHLQKDKSETALGKFKRGLGRALVNGTPGMMKTLSVVGTVAMFCVGGGILAHGIPALHHLIGGIAGSGGFISGAIEFCLTGLTGVAAGFASVQALKGAGKVFDIVKKPFAGRFSFFKKGAAADAAAPAKEGLVVSAEASPALSTVPAIKADLLVAATKQQAPVLVGKEIAFPELSPKNVHSSHP